MLKRSPMPPRRAPIARKGKRGRQDDVELAEAHIEVAYRCHGFCEFTGGTGDEWAGYQRCTSTSWRKHHRSRRGQEFGVYRNHPDNLMALCREHHDYVHAHIPWAKENGYLA